MHKRALVLAVFLALAQCAVLWIQRRYTIGEIEPPSRDLRQLPMASGSWRGEDAVVDPRLKDMLQARALVSRKCQRPFDKEVFLNAVWSDDYVHPHFPEQCYQQSGWTLSATRQISIRVTDTLSFPARLLTFERDDEQLQVLYWLQMGDRFFFNRWDLSLPRKELCWGRTRWPPLIKIMIGTTAPNLEQAESRLRNMAVQLSMWMNAVHRGSIVQELDG